MEINVKVTIDLSDRLIGLFSGLVAANAAVTKAAETVEKVTAKYAECETEPEEAPAPEEKPRARRLRAAKPVPKPEPVEEPEEEPETEPNDYYTPEPEEPEDTPPVQKSKGKVTRHDIQVKVAELVQYDDGNRDKILRQMKALGIKSISLTPEDKIEEFYAFLLTVKQ